MDVRRFIALQHVHSAEVEVVQCCAVDTALAESMNRAALIRGIGRDEPTPSSAALSRRVSLASALSLMGVEIVPKLVSSSHRFSYFPMLHPCKRAQPPTSPPTQRLVSCVVSVPTSAT